MEFFQVNGGMCYPTAAIEQIDRGKELVKLAGGDWLPVDGEELDRLIGPPIAVVPETSGRQMVVVENVDRTSQIVVNTTPILGWRLPENDCPVPVFFNHLSGMGNELGFVDDEVVYRRFGILSQGTVQRWDPLPSDYYRATGDTDKDWNEQLLESVDEFVEIVQSEVVAFLKGTGRSLEVRPQYAKELITALPESAIAIEKTQRAS